MSYQEKRSLTSTLCGVVLFGAYSIYAYSQVSSGAVTMDDLDFWAETMLYFIVIGIVVTIIMQIIFHILLSVSIAVQKRDSGEEEIDRSIKLEMVEDERGKLIELKSARVTEVFMVAGFLLGLISIALDYPAAVMLNIMFISAIVGNIIEGMFQIYFYRKG